MRAPRKVISIIGGALAALALVSIIGAGGFPSRPRFQAVGIGTAAPAAGRMTVSAADPVIDWNESDAAADNRLWRLNAGSEVLHLQAVNDAQSVGVDFIAVNRTGTTADSIALTATAITLNGVAASDFARLSVDNTLAGEQTISSTNAVARWIDTNSAVDNRRWLLQADGDQLLMRTSNDANSVFATFMTVDRTGTTVDSVNLAATSVQANGVNIAPVRAFKAADTSTASDATVNADPDLVLAVAASSVRYKLEGFFKVLSASATPGFRLSCTVPSGAAAQFVVHLSNGAAAAQQDTNVSCGQNDFTLAAGDRAMLQISGEILTSSTAGNFVITWSQSTSNATATVLEQGSWLEITRMN